LTEAPVYPDPDQSLLARQVFLIVRAFIVSSVALQLLLIVFDPVITWRWLALLLGTVTVSAGLLTLNRRGRVRFAARLLVVCLWLLVTLFVWLRAGLGTRAAYGYFVVVFIAGLALGRWQAIVTAAICSASTLLIALVAPVPSVEPVRFWLVNSLYLVLVLLLHDLAERSIRESMLRARSERHDRHLAEDELRQSEERFRVMSESGPIGIVTADAAFRLTLVNRAFCTLLGYGEEELKGRRFLEITHPEHVAGDRQAMQRLLDGEIPFYQTEKRYVRKDGGVVWAKTTASLIRGSDGRFLHFLAMIEDISDRKRAEKEREHVISQLQATLESTADGILVIDGSGKIASYNQRFARMWRIPEEVLAARDDNQALDFILEQLADPRGFLDKVRQLYDSPETESFDMLEFKDGRHFERYSRPQWIGGRPVGRVWSFRDVSERRRIEKERSEMLSRFHGFANTSQYGMGMADLDGRIVYVNPTLMHMLGEATEADCLGKHFPSAYYPPPMLRKLQEEVLPAIMREGQWHGELELRTADGRSLPTDENYFLIRDMHGQPCYLADILTDISERKRAQDALRGRNQFISSLLRAIPVAVFFKDKEGRYTGCNDEFSRIMGVSSEEIQGRTVHELWPSEFADTYHRMDLELMRERKHQVYEFQVKDKDGCTRPVLFAKDVFLDAAGEVEGMVGAFLDISDRKRAETALRESELRYRTLFEAAGDAIFILKEGRVFDCNARTLELFGRSRDQIIGSSPHKFSPPLQPDGRRSRDKAMERYRVALAGEPQFFEWLHGRPDGTLLTTEVSLNRIELAGEAYLLAIVRDVSERKRLEEQLLQAQKMEAMGVLAGGVAHDFNNILSTIVGYGSLLRMRLEGEEQLKGYVERILASGERAASLTSSLLAFSRKQESQLRPVDINAIIHGFHRILARLIGEDLDLRLNLAPGSLTADADPRQIEQVLMNLVTNSRDAMPRGGELKISTATASLGADAGGVPAGSYALIRVADSGEGMDAGTQTRMFEPFFTTKEAGKGTGLGLAIVYGIVQKHKGFIQVDSAPGRGTTFTVYLPLSAAAQGEAPAQPRQEIPRGSETILLVEDDPAVRQVTRTMLEEFGYTVIEATDGVAAQFVFREHGERIDLVVCDLLMPRLNGRETLAGLRRLKKDLRAIFITGYAADVIAEKGLADLGSRLLMKPLNPALLLQEVRAALDAR
jgi:PAS domain S-box-containing protein